MPNENAVNLLPVNTILTDIGRQKRALAIISGTTVKIEKFVVGDSNGDTYIPIGDEIALRNEKYRTYIGSMGLDKNDKSTLQISSVIPEDIGGFEISEYGLIDADGDLIAIGTCDPINKPNPSEGKIYSLAMVLIMTVLNASAFEFLINYDGYVIYQYLFDEYIAQTHNIADGAITIDKLANDVMFSLWPVAGVVHVASEFPPDGFLVANGAAVPRTVYERLFNVIGTKYGAGDGSTTFNLPDLRGIWIRGTGVNSKIIGTSADALGQYQAGGVLNHTHPDDHTHLDSGHSHGPANGTWFVTNGGGRGAQYQGGGTGGTGDTTARGNAVINYKSQVNGQSASTANNTGGISENRVANTAMLACIRY